MTTHRFGTGDGSHVALNGLALGASAALKHGVDADPIQSTRVRNFKALEDKLGRSRNLGHGNARARNHVYGRTSVRRAGDWDARCCIQGDYDAADTEPDADLGKTHTPGFRNVLTDATQHRSFGVPTVRSDIPKYARRSIADHQNYGDDATARELLYPSHLTSMGLDDQEFVQKRPKADVWALFAATGLDVDADWCHKLYGDVADADGQCSIEAFHKAVLSMA